MGASASYVVWGQGGEALGGALVEFGFLFVAFGEAFAAGLDEGLFGFGFVPLAGGLDGGVPAVLKGFRGHGGSIGRKPSFFEKKDQKTFATGSGADLVTATTL